MRPVVRICLLSNSMVEQDPLLEPNPEVELIIQVVNLTPLNPSPFYLPEMQLKLQLTLETWRYTFQHR